MFLCIIFFDIVTLTYDLLTLAMWRIKLCVSSARTNF